MKPQSLLLVSGLVLFTAPAFLACGPPAAYPADPYYDARAGAGTADQYDCERIAENAAGSTVTEVGKGAIVGGAVGAAAGAAAGAIAGDAGKGAAIGAATGGVGGAAVQGVRKNERYNDVYASCMRERGYNVY